MPWSAGVYTRGYASWTADANNNLPISATKFDLEDNDFAAGINQCVNVTGVNGYWPKTSQETTLGITPTSYLFPPLDIRRYGADPTGVADSTAAITNAISVAVQIGAGDVYLAQGTYLVSSSLTLENAVTLNAYGATINFSGASGYALTTPATAATLRTGIRGLTINLQNAAAGALRLGSSYAGAFRDIRVTGVAASANVVVLLDTNTTGTANPGGNLNTAFNLFDGLTIEPQCGTAIRLIGTSASNVSTDNVFNNVQVGAGGNTQGATVYGVEFNQWCDSNTFNGQTRIQLFSNNGGTASGIGVAFGNGAGGGCYAESFQNLAVDTFGSPATDNRQGIIANSTTVKFIVLELFEYGPATGLGAMANVANLLSSYINQAPRAATNYESIHMLGANLGVGAQALSSIGVYVQNVGQISGATQYGIHVVTPGFNSGSPALAVGVAAQPNLASSAGAYTVANVVGLLAEPAALGTNATATTVTSVLAQNQTVGATNIGVQTQQNSNTANDLGFFASGTAPNQFNGPTAVGGTATNNNAAAGFVGETVTSVVNSGGAVALVNATAANVTSISLTAGDWDVWGHVVFSPAGTTTVAFLAGGVSSTSGSLGTLPQQSGQMAFASFAPGAVPMTQDAPVQRVTLSATTTIYLVAQSNFGVSTMGAYGAITARRRR